MDIFLLFSWHRHIKVTLATTVCPRKKFAILTLVPLNSLRSHDTFHLILDEAFKYANTLELIEAPLASKQIQTPNILPGNETSSYNGICDIKTFCRYFYLNLVNRVN